MIPERCLNENAMARRKQRNLKRTHNWTDEEANARFDGDENQQKRGNTLNAALRSQVNHSHGLPANRMIEEANDEN